MRFLGVDPGVSGGAVLLDFDARLIAFWITPTIAGKGARRDHDLPAMAKIAASAIDFAGTTPLDDDVTMAIEFVAARPSAAAKPDEDPDGPGAQARASGQAHGMIAAAKLLYSAGAWEALAAANRMELLRIAPGFWVPRLLELPRGSTYKQRKAAAAKKAAELYPALGPFLRKRANWGVADAALLATAGLRMTAARARAAERKASTV